MTTQTTKRPAAAKRAKAPKQVVPAAEAAAAEPAPVPAPEPEPAPAVTEAVIDVPVEAKAKGGDKKKKDKKEKKEKKAKKAKKEAVIIRFEDEQLAKIDAQAEALGLARAAWVRMVVAKSLAAE